MEQANTIGLDIAKHVFQVHGADAAGHVLFRKRVTRAKLIGFLATQAPCIVAMEACAGANYWAREISKLGHRVQLIAPAYVKPFVKRQKNDAVNRSEISGGNLAWVRRRWPDRRSGHSSAPRLRREGCCRWAQAGADG